MSKRDAIQTAINRASLTMHTSEELSKALQVGETHPALAMALMQMHHSIKEQDSAIKELRTSMLQIAQTLEAGASISVATHLAIDRLANSLGIDKAQLFGLEQDVQGNG